MTTSTNAGTRKNLFLTLGLCLHLNLLCVRLEIVVPVNIPTSPMAGIFPKTPTPSPLEIQIKLYTLVLEILTLTKFQSLLWREYRHFLELLIMHIMQIMLTHVKESEAWVICHLEGKKTNLTHLWTQFAPCASCVNISCVCTYIGNK